MYREMWEDVMYNVAKVVDLVRHFSELCQRHGLCDEKTFPQNFISIIKEVEKYTLLPLKHHHRSYGFLGTVSL
jgi:hypothetical protein